MFARREILVGDADVLVAGGMESMTNAPYLLPKARGGYRMGNGEIIDSMIHDGLWDPYDNLHMGHCGDAVAAKYGFTREDQDAVRRRFLQARPGRPAGGPLQGRDHSGDGEDEEGRHARRRGRRAQAGTARQDGGPAAGLLEGRHRDGGERLDAERRRRRAARDLRREREGEAAATVLARIVADSTAAVEPKWFTIAPVHALAKLYEKTKSKPLDWDLYEINEAFSGVTMAAMKDHGIPHDRVNVHGGAVSLGHPIGCSGARILVTMLHALRQRGQKTGIATLCIGGGEAVALGGGAGLMAATKHTIGVIGTGTMGQGIAQVAAQAGHEVVFQNRASGVGRPRPEGDREAARAARREAEAHREREDRDARPHPRCRPARRDQGLRARDRVRARGSRSQARAAPEARRDRLGRGDHRHQHLESLDHQAGVVPEAAGALRRPALLQSGADDEARRGGARHAHQRLDGAPRCAASPRTSARCRST